MEETHSINHAEDPFTWGPCEHTDTPILLGVGEVREESVRTMEPEPGVFVDVKYFATDTPVTYVAQVACPVCGNRQVFTKDSPFVVTEPEPTPPPQPTTCLEGATDATPGGTQ